MTYQAINWDTEAQRVARAFGVEGECFWFDSRGDMFLNFKDADTPPYGLPISKDIFVTVYYCSNWRYFEIFDGAVDAAMYLRWDGSLGEVDIIAHGNTLARALFHLDLLTPEVETALGVSISAHEKIEWLREYEARYGEG